MIEELEKQVRDGDVGQQARERGDKEVRIKAHVQRKLLGFYERCGYKLEGGEFDEVSEYPIVKPARSARSRRDGDVKSESD